MTRKPNSTLCTPIAVTQITAMHCRRGAFVCDAVAAQQSARNLEAIAESRRMVRLAPGKHAVRPFVKERVA